MYHVGWFPFAGGWLVGLLVFAAFVVLIAWGIAWILRGDSRYRGAPPPMPPAVPPSPSPRADPALQILRERFARGEISEAEYLTASRVLGAPEPPPGSGTGPAAGAAARADPRRHVPSVARPITKRLAFGKGSFKVRPRRRSAG